MLTKKQQNCLHQWNGTKVVLDCKKDIQKQINEHHKDDKCLKCKIRLYDYQDYVIKELGVERSTGKIIDKRIAPGA